MPNPTAEQFAQQQFRKQGLSPAPAGMPPRIGDQYIGQPRNDVVDPTGSHILNSIRGVEDPPGLDIPMRDSAIGQMLEQTRSNDLSALVQRLRSKPFPTKY